MLSYVEGNRIFEGSGPPGGIGEALARKYFRDVVAGLSYLHSHVRDSHLMLFNSLFCVAGAVHKSNLRISEGFYSSLRD